MEEKFSLGSFVQSKAGRDKDRIFIIVDIISDNYVYVSDGDLRKIETPKRKKIKHLKAVNVKSDTISEKLENKEKVTNSIIRKEIEQFGLNYSIRRTDING